MINTITVINEKGEELVLDMRNPYSTGFFIKSIDGIGPPKASINTMDYATIDGSRFTSARSNQRNIVLNLGFLEFPTIEETRQISYKYFPVKGSITLIFETDIRTVYIEGKVESNEPNIFSKEEDCFISIICPDPYFRSLLDEVVDFSFTEKLFTFPFSNNDLSIKLIYFGNLALDNEKNLEYVGEVPVGFKFTIDITGPVGTITIYNLVTSETMVINNTIITSMTGAGLNDGDIITIVTIKGQKSVILTRAGVNINILNSVIDNVDWFTLTNGDNLFHYSAVSGSNYLIFRMDYEILYEGV